MKTVSVHIGARSYDIRIGRQMDSAPFYATLRVAKALIVTDSHVDPLFGAACEAALRAGGVDAIRAVFPAGEASKTLTTLADLYECAAQHGLDRDSRVVALGGGVVGDMAGFLAATYMRGIGLIQVPTTLLAMVDSSSGGKTGFNLKQGKNLVGAFWQPQAVWADTATLDSLPRREYRSGLAEIVKCAAIRDAALLTTIEEGGAALLRREPTRLEEVIARCCQIKADVVAADERESGVRAILNFGHTLGHALEQVSDYKRWRHGEAVAMGAVYAARLSVREAGLPACEARRLETVMRQLDLPTVPDAPIPAWPALRAAMQADKKSRRGRPRFALIERLGRSGPPCEPTEETMHRVYEEWIGNAHS
jgi:3-dehydroquinate synthase